MNQPANSSHYSFGDNDLAAERLELLAATYSASSACFLSHALPERVERAADLGCGLGHTTHLLRERSRAGFVVGYERSPRYVARAAEHYPDLSFREVDVLTAPYPDSDLDVIYCRFLLTHVHRPELLLEVALRHLRARGRLLLEETYDLQTPLEALQRYYGLVAEMQAHHGQELYIGRRLEEIASSLAGARATGMKRSITVPPNSMARLHAMNIATWKHEAYMLDKYGLTALEQLELELTELSRSRDEFEPVNCIMAQVVVERLD